MKKKLEQELIPGIFNYCDGWCKRCPFKDRCAVGGIGDMEYEGSDGEFRQMSGFVQSVDVSIKVLGDSSAWESPEEEEAYEKRQFEIKRFVRQHEITKLAKKYMNVTREFFDNELIGKMRGTMENFDGMKDLGIISPERVKEIMIGLAESLEKLEWYHILIGFKIQLALESRVMEHDWDGGADILKVDGGMPPQKDHDGVCKVVLLSIDKSMAAWRNVREVIPDTDPTVSKALANLGELKSKILREFPDAMKFRRPGFDEDIYQLSLN